MKSLIFAPIAVAVLALATPDKAQAGDFKFYSAGGCAPYTTGTPNYSELRFRSDGVQNQSNGYRFVICPIVRDSESSWGLDATGDVQVYFRTNSAGTFQCTLTGGSTAGGSYSLTEEVSGNPGDTLYIDFSAVDVYNNGASDAPMSLVCRLPPKGTLAKYWVDEDDVTDDPPAP
jgi:hypothetical protein